jgi:hypothetical protein
MTAGLRRAGRRQIHSQLIPPRNSLRTDSCQVHSLQQCVQQKSLHQAAAKKGKPDRKAGAQSYRSNERRAL